MKLQSRYRVLPVALALASALSLGNVQAQTDRSSKPLELTWLAMTPGQVFHLDGFEFTGTFDQETYERHDYIQGPDEPRPREFYHHGRGIRVAFSHHHQFLLVDDNYTTKLSKLMVVDLNSFKETDVSSAAVATNRYETKIGQRNFVNPRAIGLSLNDRKLLLAVELTYIDASTAEEAAKVSVLFPPQQYVVDTRSGRVEGFKTGKAPE